jgi:hypothetical protein
MGHIFCEPYPPNAPVVEKARASEYEFFGWEVAVARAVRLGGAFRASNADYDFSGQQAPFMSAKQWRDRCEERLRVAKERGLVSSDGAPLSVRGLENRT